MNWLIWSISSPLVVGGASFLAYLAARLVVGLIFRRPRDTNRGEQ